MTYKTAKERLESRYIPVPESGCWLWLGNAQRGYGVMTFDYGKRREFAHRVSYKLYKGPIPDGMKVCHKCDVPGCINPDHLFLGTQADNIRDMDAKGRRRNAPKPGDTNGNSKLSDDVAKAIYDDPRPQRQVAAAFGVSQRLVWNIKHRKTWTHVHV